MSVQARSEDETIEPALTGTLHGLKFLEPDDLAEYRKAVSAGQQFGWKYYFPYLLSLNRPGRKKILYTEDEGSACVFLWQQKDDQPRLDLYLAPAPMNTQVLSRCIERVNEYNRNFSGRIMGIDAKDVDAVTNAGVRTKPRKDQYLFAPSEYQNLRGNKLYTVRRNVSLVERKANVKVKPYKPAYADACRTLLTQWQVLHRERHGTSGGMGFSRRAIDLAGTLPAKVLKGEVIFIGNELAGFAFGGEIRPGLGCFFERKCDADIRGLSYFQLRSFLLALQDFEYVNDSSDAGRPGLRQLKDSFRPAHIHREFRGRVRQN